jgi:cell division protein FtsB
MSGHGFHVHGPHDHALEHAAQGGHGGEDGFAARIAVTTAILATLGALFGYEGGHTQNAALLYKNDAAIQKTAASDQWNYYQAKSNKQNLAELAAVLTLGADREKYKQDIERYKKEKAEVKAGAEKLEAAAKEADKHSDEEMHIHGRWALAATLLQISIALSAIALLTRRTWLLLGVYGASAVGIGVAIMGALHL